MYPYIFRKSLLSEGLRFLIDVFHLFPPIDEVKAHSKAASLRTEALDVSSCLLEELLSLLPLEGEGDDQTVDESRQGKEDDSVIASHSQEPGEIIAAQKDIEENVVNPSESSTTETEGQSALTEWEREVDRDVRLKILLKLLQMACMMVRANTLYFTYKPYIIIAALNWSSYSAIAKLYVHVQDIEVNIHEYNWCI